MTSRVNRHVRALLVVSASGFVLTPTAGLAQEAADSSNSEPAPETIVVTGIRASYERALETKRNADAIVDAISAEDVGKFPDQNVAESLSHLPGLAVDRSFGQGEKVSILGTDPALNRVLINGQTIASADWGGDPEHPSSRTFNYLMLSPQLIGLAEVFKSQEARLDEGSIGGTVIIHTRKPFELAANTFAGSGGYEYNDRSRAGSVRGSVLYSWKNDSDTFGVLAAYTHDKEELARAGLEVFGYASAANFRTAAPTAQINGDPTNAVFPAGINAAYFHQIRQRDGFSTTLQARPTDSLTLDLTGIYITGKYDNFNNALFVFPAASTALLQSATVTDGLVTSASYGPGAYTEHDGGYRKTGVGTNSVNLNANWDSGGAFALAGTVGITRAHGALYGDPEYTVDLRDPSPYSYSFNANGASVNWANKPTDPAVFTRPVGEQVGGIGSSPIVDVERYAQTDLTWNVDAGPFKKLLVGAKYIYHQNFQHSWGSKVFVQNTPVSALQFGPGMTPANLFDGVGLGGDLTRWVTIGQNALVNYDSTTPTGDVFREDPSTEFDIREKTRNVYVQGNFEGTLAGRTYRGNIGVRYVHTSDDSSGFLVDSESGAATPVDTVTSYNKFLPSLNLAYSLTEEIMLRFGVSKVISRPRYSDMAQYFSLSDLQLTGSGGNPDLKPYESVNYNLTVEWYFDKGALASAELFVRDMSNYIVSKEHDEVLFNKTVGGGTTYAVTTPINAEKAIVRGASAQFQMPIALGFGIATNYTYAKAQTTNNYFMPYLSKHTVNVIPYYEQGPVSIRVSYGFRSKYFTSIGRLNASQFTDKYTELDASASYNFTSNLRLTLDASNLLDEKYFAFNGVQAAPIGIYRNGRLYSATVTYKF